MVDIQEASRILDGVSSVNGNIDPVSILLNGSPETIRDGILECIQVTNDSSLISAGCEVPRDTSNENLMAVNETLKSY